MIFFTPQLDNYIWEVVSHFLVVGVIEGSKIVILTIILETVNSSEVLVNKVSVSYDYVKRNI